MFRTTGSPSSYTRNGNRLPALLTLAADSKASVQVRAVTHAKLDEVRRRSNLSSPLEAYLAARIRQFQVDPGKFIAAKPVEAPPGMPIGDDED